MPENYFKHLNVSSFERKWGIYITTVGHSIVNATDDHQDEKYHENHHFYSNRGRMSNDYYVVFISKGRGIYCSSITKKEEVLAGKCFLMHPGTGHKYRPDPKFGSEEYWVGFNGNFVQQLMNQDIFDPLKPIVDVGLNTEMLVLYNRLIRKTKLSALGYRQQIAGITMQIIGLICSLEKNDERPYDPLGKLIAKAKLLIQESFEKSMDMEKLARELPMGYSSFRKAFKNATGSSPNQYHVGLRLERARNLLMMNELNISEISDQTGFESIYYFSKLFKKKNGISPRSYRLLHTVA